MVRLSAERVRHDLLMFPSRAAGRHEEKEKGGSKNGSVIHRRFLYADHRAAVMVKEGMLKKNECYHQQLFQTVGQAVHLLLEELGEPWEIGARWNCRCRYRLTL
jgi:hypothetical protein